MLSKEPPERLQVMLGKILEGLDEKGLEDFQFMADALNFNKNPPASLQVDEAALRGFMAYILEMSEAIHVQRMMNNENVLQHPQLVAIAAAMGVGFKLGQRAS